MINKQIDVVVLVLPGASAGPVALTQDIFRAAHGLRDGQLMGVYGPGWQVSVVSVAGGSVPLAGGMSVETQALDQRQADVVLIPGLGIPDKSALMERLAADDAKEAAGWLVSCAARGLTIAASCTATFLLARAGLLDGRKATTTWWMAGAMARHFSQIQVDAAQVLCLDGPIWTAGASLGHLDLCLRIVEVWAGEAMARAVSRVLLLPHEPRSQAAHMMADHLRHTDPLLLEAEAWIASRIKEPIKVPQLAKALGKSPRTLARLLHQKAQMTPSQLIVGVRLREACRLLERTNESVDAIAHDVGFGDTSAFWRAFRRELQITPAAYRKQWQRRE